MHKHPLYNRFRWIQAACYSPKSPDYPSIGGQGIGCYWHNKEFREFVVWVESNLGALPGAGHKLGRIDHQGDFAPGNLAWSTAKQVGNRCLKNTYIEYQGRRQSLKQWAEEYGVNYHTFRDRYFRGWDFQKALETGVWEFKHAPK